MRHFGFMALLAPFALLAFGCEEDPSSSPGGFQLPEGGSGFEIPDSSTPPPDSSTPDAPAPSGVTVTVKQQGAPQKDVRVIFHDATGAVTGDFKSDATGVVTQPVAPSMVTVLAPDVEAGFAPLTYLGVAEGDSLTVELGGDSPNGSPPLGEYSVTLGGGFDNVQSYWVQASRDCWSNSGPADDAFIIGVTAECVGAKGVVLATASQDGQPQAFSFAKNLAKPMGGSTVTVGPLPAFVAPGSLTVTAANVPPNAYFRASVAAVADGLPFDIGVSSELNAGSPVTFRVPAGFADAHQASVSGFSASSSVAIIKREPATVSSIAFDHASLLPGLTDANVVATDLKRPKLTWSSSAPLNAVDGGVVALRWYAGSASMQWRFVVPPGTTEVTAPALPADLAIPPSVEADVQWSDIAFAEATFIADYKAFKSLAIPANHDVSVLSRDAALPVDGTVRTVRFGD